VWLEAPQEVLRHFQWRRWAHWHHGDVARIKTVSDATNGATFSSSVKALEDNQDAWSWSVVAEDAGSKETKMAQSLLGRANPQFGRFSAYRWVLRKGAKVSFHRTIQLHLHGPGQLLERTEELRGVGDGLFGTGQNCREAKKAVHLIGVVVNGDTDSGVAQALGVIEAIVAQRVVLGDNHVGRRQRGKDFVISAQW
jgi:hypothetical protein